MNMKSILQKDKSRCYICGGYGTSVDPLDCHHVFFGALRSKSDRYGLTVYIHHNRCHIFGRDAVHVNAEVDRALKKRAQIAAMQRYGWSEQEFINEFRKSYIGGKNES